MTLDLSSLLSFVTAFATVAFVGVAVLWLRRTRSSVAAVMGEAALQQLRTAQNFATALEKLQKNQQTIEQQIQTLALAHNQLRKDLQIVADRAADAGDAECKPSPLPGRTVH